MLSPDVHLSSINSKLLIVGTDANMNISSVTTFRFQKIELAT